MVNDYDVLNFIIVNKINYVIVLIGTLIAKHNFELYRVYTISLLNITYLNSYF